MKRTLTMAGALLWVLAGPLFAANPPPAPIAGSDSIRAMTLDNGLRILVWPDHDIPSVAFYNYVRAGSRNEAPGITGLAHFFEHMMFNGTHTRPPGTFDREMEAQGGANNASTSDDLTIYTNWLPSSALELVMDLESDRLSNLAFDPKVVESERGVVYSERRLRVDDNNTGFLFEQVQGIAFVAHPYHIPTIGWPSDIEGWTMEDLQSFYKTYYAPNNCTLVIVGDVDPDRVFSLAKKYFGPIPRQADPPAVRTVEPPQPGEKRVDMQRRAQTPLLQLAYKAPKADDPRRPALDLLSAILAEGDASRLHRTFVEERKLAIDVSVYSQEGFDPGLFWLFFTLPEGGDAKELNRQIDAEIERVRTQGVTEVELTRAKNLLAAQFWRQVATISGKASLIGQSEVMYGGYARFLDYPTQLTAVTTADIQAVAKELFDPRGRTIGVLVPAPNGEEG